MLNSLYPYQDISIIRRSKDGLIHGVSLAIVDYTDSVIDFDEGDASELLNVIKDIEAIYGGGLARGLEVENCNRKFQIVKCSFDAIDFIMTYYLRIL